MIALAILIAMAGLTDLPPCSNGALDCQPWERSWGVAPPVGTVVQQNLAARNQAALQVGDLIANGRCDDAKRLAAYYDQKEMKRAVARACP